MKLQFADNVIWVCRIDITDYSGINVTNLHALQFLILLLLIPTDQLLAGDQLLACLP